MVRLFLLFDGGDVFIGLEKSGWLVNVCESDRCLCVHFLLLVEIFYKEIDYGDVEVIGDGCTKYNHLLLLLHL